MQELLDLTFDWFATSTHFRVRSSVYAKTPAKRGLLRLMAGDI
jgi:hypothetical protein